jgi:hypothetical protein
MIPWDPCPILVDTVFPWSIGHQASNLVGSCGPASPDCERHEPEKALLHHVVRGELEPFLARARQSGAPVARFVEREIRAHLDWGVLANGFLRVHCDDCGHDRLVAFSCKGRGFCPSWRWSAHGG